MIGLTDVITQVDDTMIGVYRDGREGRRARARERDREIGLSIDRWLDQLGRLDGAHHTQYNTTAIDAILTNR